MFAQTSPSAEQLFREGRQALQQNHLAEARTKLEASQKAEPAAGTLLNLAECYEKLGLTATAYDTYAEARDAAQKRGRADWEKLASDRISVLAPRLPRLRITGKAPSAASVLLDGRLYDRAGFGKSSPIDPGTHRVTVIDNARELFVREVVTKEGGTTEVVIDIPEAAPPQVALPVAPPRPETKPVPATPIAPDPAPSTGPSPFVWVLGGASLASFGVGTAFLLVRNGQAHSATDEMNASKCYENPVDRRKCQEIYDRGQANLMSVAPQVIAAVAGGVFAISAVALYFATVGPAAPRAGSGPRAMCMPGIGGGACVVQF